MLPFFTKVPKTKMQDVVWGEKTMEIYINNPLLGGVFFPSSFYVTLLFMSV